MVALAMLYRSKSNQPNHENHLSFSQSLPTYHPLPTVPSWLKDNLGKQGAKTVFYNGLPLLIREFSAQDHNLYHCEVAMLNPIKMGQVMVTGINGFCSPMYHDRSIQPEYDGTLDEVRIGVHEGLTRPSLFACLKLVYMSGWMISAGINPLMVILRHSASLRQFKQQHGEPVQALCIKSLVLTQYPDSVDSVAQAKKLASGDF